MNASRPSPPASGTRLRIVAGIAFLALLAGTVVAWALAVWGMMPLPGFALSMEAVEQEVASWGAWGAAGSILLMILHSFIPFPAEFLAMANGMLFGPFWGVVVTWSGAMLGAFLAFGLARWLGRPFVLAMPSVGQRGALDRWTQRAGGGTLLLSRFVPVISFNLINYAAGLTPMTWWTFAWATGIGILPLTLLMVLVGDRLWEGDSQAWLWLAAAALVGCLLWSAARRLRRTNDAKGPPPDPT